MTDYAGLKIAEAIEQQAKATRAVAQAIEKLAAQHSKAPGSGSYRV